MMRTIGIILGLAAAALAAYGFSQTPALTGAFWLAPIGIAAASIIFIFAAEERRMRLGQAARERANAEQLKKTESQQVHGGSSGRKTI